MARKRNEEAHAKKRKQILEAAAALFLDQGFHQTGMAAICEAAGMSPGTLYRYFPSKTDIIIAFVEDEVAETSQWLEGLAESKDFKAALIKGLVQVMVEVSDRDYGQLAMDIAAEAGRNDVVGAALEAADADASARFSDLIQAHSDCSKAEARTAARMIGFLIDGAIGAGDNLPSQKKLTGAVESMVGGLL